MQHTRVVVSLALLICLGSLQVTCADIMLSIDDIDVPVGTSTVVIPIHITGTSNLNALSLAIGLGDGVTETALITAFSLDQTIWDTNPLIGQFSTTSLSGPIGATPGLPIAATVFDFAPFSASSFANPNGVALFLTLDVSGKTLGSSFIMDPNFIGFTVANEPSNPTPITATFQTGTLQITAVPEPTSLALVLAACGGATLAGRKRIRRRLHIQDLAV